MWEPSDQQLTSGLAVDEDVYGDDIEVPMDDGDYEWISLR